MMQYEGDVGVRISSEDAGISKGGYQSVRKIREV